jgi:hypothetical protein
MEEWHYDMFMTEWQPKRLSEMHFYSSDCTISSIMLSMRYWCIYMQKSRVINCEFNVGSNIYTLFEIIMCNALITLHFQCSLHSDIFSAFDIEGTR